MDQELERALRAAREAPEELAPAIRLAAVTERLGLFRDAWTTLVRLSSRTDDEPSLLQALAGLAKRNPAATVGYLAECEADRARFSCLTLGKAGALLPLVVLACRVDATPLTLDAQIALRRAVAPEHPGLPGVTALEVYLSGESSRAWRPYMGRVMQIVTNYGHAELFRELASEDSPEGTTQETAGAAVPNLGATFSVPRGADLAKRIAVARDLVTRARSERRFELLPWVHSAAAARDTTLASEAISVFQELTGRLAPPLDPAELARRWV